MTIITLVVNKLKESVLAQKLLKDNQTLLENNQIKTRTIYSSSDCLPSLIVEGDAFPYKGYNEIRKYINSVKE